MSGAVICALIFGRAAAASISGTATRITSHPTSSNWRICAIVAATSRVSVDVIDCTDTGASPPILTRPTRICLVFRRVMNIIVNCPARLLIALSFLSAPLLPIGPDVPQFGWPPTLAPKDLSRSRKCLPPSIGTVPSEDPGGLAQYTNPGDQGLSYEHGGCRDPIPLRAPRIQT